MTADAMEYISTEGNPFAGEKLAPADVDACYRSTDVADRFLRAAIEASFHFMREVSCSSRPALIAAHMQVSAMAYLAERMPASLVPGLMPAKTPEVGAEVKA